MAKIESDSFEGDMKNYLKFHKSTMTDGDVKESYRLAKQTRQIIFGINRKQDNQHKTKQLNLF